MQLKECIHNLTHSLLQQGAPMRKRGYGSTPNPTKDITTSSSVDGRKNYQPGRNHISVPVVVKENKTTSYCKYKKCPGLNSAAKRPRAYRAKYVCEECTMEKGSNFWLCNSTKEVDGNLVVVDCHTAYHVDKKFYTTTAPPPGITTECCVVSDLTDE
ncbi:hypothetical protein FRACYDRAFT_252509 [Fragilariopsis cylindrus CCMP1102]|uniref:Uncharacterized protein n=1 Tax=Fragilariopsis cylindrus CCMP1102 TaxID=635003 RepID=A0A1E7EM91_9STRA|nr:hypothetical protein FRACYDRAFT_252509 [Fragilariopsis cylindrus CCMP1102]|eukprot:OEU07038.1 hypothetical protein FRACYDRAFT_252509 [Fragilariopsis cylindrus CCMP1102]